MARGQQNIFTLNVYSDQPRVDPETDIKGDYETMCKYLEEDPPWEDFGAVSDLEMSIGHSTTPGFVIINLGDGPMWVPYPDAMKLGAMIYDAGLLAQRSLGERRKYSVQVDGSVVRVVDRDPKDPKPLVTKIISQEEDEKEHF